MKNSKLTVIVKTVFIILGLSLFQGCGEYLDNPLIDKESGEDINVLIIDFNFFKTSMSYKLFDATDGSLITKRANITFAGKNGNDIVTYAGEKKEEFNISQGQLELTIDPNIEISETTPFDFAVNVDINGYNHLSKGIRIVSEGKKSFEFYLSKTSNREESELTGNLDNSSGNTVFNFSGTNGTKSVLLAKNEYTISYSVTMNDLLKFKDSAGNLLFKSEDEALSEYNKNSNDFIKLTISKFADYRSGTELVKTDGTVKNVLFRKLETGTFVKLTVGGKPVADFNGGTITSTCKYTGATSPVFFGFTKFEDGAWNGFAEKVVYDKPEFGYTLAEVTDDSLCETGGEITFTSNCKSSFSIDADVYDSNNNYLFSRTFKGNFPETFILENVPDKPVKMVFRNNNPAFKPIAPLTTESLCTGKYNAEVEMKDNYVEYQVVLRAMCADNPTVGIAPTYNAEIKLKGSNDAWQGVSMQGGKTDILCIPGREYEIRLLWEGEWEYATYFTEFDKDGNYTHKVERGTKIVSHVLNDGRVQINIEKIFSQSICSDMGW